MLTAPISGDSIVRIGGKPYRLDTSPSEFKTLAAAASTSKLKYFYIKVCVSAYVKFQNKDANGVNWITLDGVKIESVGDNIEELTKMHDLFGYKLVRR